MKFPTIKRTSEEKQPLLRPLLRETVHSDVQGELARIDPKAVRLAQETTTKDSLHKIRDEVKAGIPMGAGIGGAVGIGAIGLALAPVTCGVSIPIALGCLCASVAAGGVGLWARQSAANRHRRSTADTLHGRTLKELAKLSSSNQTDALLRALQSTGTVKTRTKQKGSYDVVSLGAIDHALISLDGGRYAMNAEQKSLAKQLLVSVHEKAATYRLVSHLQMKLAEAELEECGDATLDGTTNEAKIAELREGLEKALEMLYPETSYV